MDTLEWGKHNDYDDDFDLEDVDNQFDGNGYQFSFNGSSFNPLEDVTGPFTVNNYNQPLQYDVQPQVKEEATGLFRFEVPSFFGQPIKQEFPFQPRYKTQFVFDVNNNNFKPNLLDLYTATATLCGTQDRTTII
jgi:hypothetical protein